MASELTAFAVKPGMVAKFEEVVYTDTILEELRFAQAFLRHRHDERREGPGQGQGQGASSAAAAGRSTASCPRAESLSEEGKFDADQLD